MHVIVSAPENGVSPDKAILNSQRGRPDMPSTSATPVLPVPQPTGPKATRPVVPVNDLRPAAARLADDLRDAVLTVMESYWYLEGPYVRRFESEFAKYIGAAHAIAVGNGTDALELALRAAGVERGDEVITVANAGGYTSTACVAIGAVPCYVDIDPASLLVCEDSVVESLSPKTRAIVVTHLYGQIVDVPRLRARIGADIPIIEDCAQAHGGRLRGVTAGHLPGSTLSTFSFYPTKNLGAAGDAGMVLTDDAAAADRVRRLKQYGWSSRYVTERPYGRNSRMDEVQAAILSVKLPSLEAWNKERAAIAQRYDAVFADTPYRVLPTAGTGAAHHLYVVRPPHREAFRAFMESRGVETAIHYPVLDCDQPAMTGIPWRAGPLTESRRAASEIVTLPCYPGMSPEKIEHVVTALEEALKR